jgi:hypothetical protein
MRRSTRSIRLLGYTLSAGCFGECAPACGWGGKVEKVKGKSIKVKVASVAVGAVLGFAQCR